MSGFKPFDPSNGGGGGGVPVPSNVVYVTQESDFGTVVPATRIDVTPNTTFVLNAPVTQTLPFLLATGSSFQLLTTSRIINQLTYTNAVAAQFQGTNVGLAIFDVILQGNETATLFDITGGILSLKFPDFVRYSDLGTVRDLVDFYAPGVFFEIIDSGLDMIDCISHTLAQCLIIAQDANVLTFLNISGASSGDTQILDNIMLNDSSSSFIDVDGATFPTTQTVTLIGNNVLLPDNFYGPGSLDQTDPRILAADNKGSPDSVVSGEANLNGNATTTDIPAVGAQVLIAASTWTAEEESRITIGTDGVSTFNGAREVSLKFDGNITLEPSNATKNLSASFIRVLAGRTTVTFTNGTNTVNDTATPLVDDDRVMFRDNAGTLPTGLREDVVYYVVSQAVNSFQLSYTEGGAAVAFSDDGSGTNAYAVCELHGAKPQLSIQAANPANLVPQALMPSDTSDQALVVVSNLSDAVNILVLSSYYRVVD